MSLPDWAKPTLDAAVKDWEDIAFGKVTLTIEGHYAHGQLNAIHVKTFTDEEHRPPRTDGVAGK